MIRGSWLLLGILGVLLASGAARAQEIPALKRELEAMREQFESVKAQYERRMKELGERLQALESQETMRAGPAPAVTRDVPPPAAAVTPSVTQMITPRQPFALSTPGRALLFDIGVSGDFVGDLTSRARERARDGTFQGRENRFFPREVSVGLFGRVDPYASATVKLSAGEGARSAEREPDITLRLDEGYITLLTLPLGTVARLGMMRPYFGTLNSVHQDDLPQVDRPQVLARFFGEEELDGERGVDATWILPSPFYQELSVGIFDGDNETAFGRGSLRDPLVLGRLRSFFELEEWGGFQIDLSGGTRVTADDHRHTVAAIGLKYKWVPSTGYAFPVVTLAGEGVFGNRVVEADDHARRFERWGYYVYGQYDWSRRWAVGLRYDWTQFPTESGREWALSPYLQFRPSEFLRFRVQYKHTERMGVIQREADEIFLQGSFILGAHPTERF